MVRIEAASSVGGKSGKLTLKTLDMESDFSIGARMMDAITKEHVQVGDVIQVDKASGMSELVVDCEGHDYNFGFRENCKDWTVDCQSFRLRRVWTSCKLIVLTWKVHIESFTGESRSLSKR